MAIAAVAMAVVMGAGSLFSDDDSAPTGATSNSPEPSTADTSSAAPTSSSSSPSPTLTETPTPTTPWGELLEDGADDELLEPDEVDGLPEGYWPSPGSDEYTDEEYERVLRRDIAAYLLRVRHEAPRVADRLAYALPSVPVGWCSVVAPRWTWTEFQQNASENVKSAALLADLLKVPYEPLLPADQTRLMRFAVGEAARWFCPENRLNLSEPVEDPDVEDAAEFPTRDVYHLQELQREGYAVSPADSYRARTATEFEIELAFQSALVGVGDVPTELGCDTVRYLSRRDNDVRDTAENIWELSPSRDDRLWDVWEHQTLVYLIEEERRACIDGRL